MQGKYRRGGMNRTVLRYRPPQERPPNRLRTHTRHRPDPAAADLRPNPLKTLERATGIEPATRSLGSYCSTTELHPRQELLTCPHGCEKRRFTEHCLSSSKLGCVENGCVICSAEVPASFHVLTHGVAESSPALSPCLWRHPMRVRGTPRG
jgi:hypothetical protein